MKTILYTGYAYSGGTIIGELFREIDEFLVLPGKQPGNMEFRLLKERYGICDLEDAIFNTLDPEIIDLAIKDFRWLSQNYARSSSSLGKPGYAYQSRSGNVFINATNKYLNSITDFEYPMDWHFYDFKKSGLQYAFKKITKKITNNKKLFRETAYLAYPSKKTFINLTRDYLKTIMSSFLNELSVNSEDKIVLPKSIPLYSEVKVRQIINYFDEPKLIIIDRDPRDIFFEIISSGRDRYIPMIESSEKKAEGFIKFFKSIRRDQHKIADLQEVCIVKFEDMCQNYEESVSNIFSFIDINPNLHSKKMTKFTPEISKKNIGKWKTDYSNNRQIYKYIERNLEEFIHQ